MKTTLRCIMFRTSFKLFDFVSNMWLEMNMLFMDMTLCFRLYFGYYYYEWNILSIIFIALKCLMKCNVMNCDIIYERCWLIKSYLKKITFTTQLKCRRKQFSRHLYLCRRKYLQRHLTLVVKRFQRNLTRVVKSAGLSTTPPINDNRNV